MEERADRYIVLHPKNSDEKTRHKYSLIWLHGLGDSAYGFQDVFLDDNLNIVPPSCKVILATAPERAVTCNGGMVMTSWYDIHELGLPHTSSLADRYGNVSQSSYPFTRSSLTLALINLI